MNNMKRFGYIVMMAAMVVMAVTACKKDVPPQGDDKTPTVKIETKSVGATSATFTITATNAEDVYLYCSEADATAEDVKSKGTKGVGNEATIDKLNANTAYTAYALAVNGDKQAIANVEFTTTEDDTPFEGYNLDKLVSAVYRTDNEVVAGNYEVTFGNTTKMEWDGDMQVFLDLYNVADSDPINPVLPSGTLSVLK